jgi:regulatory protein YycI of two-component signal transduction system YycFG
MGGVAVGFEICLSMSNGAQIEIFVRKNLISGEKYNFSCVKSEKRAKNPEFGRILH